MESEKFDLINTSIRHNSYRRIDSTLCSDKWYTECIEKPFRSKIQVINKSPTLSREAVRNIVSFGRVILSLNLLDPPEIRK